ncbi:MAG: hypothetical protein RIB61_11195 [Roseicyclus sp.]|jgi:hypothetical protein
MTTSDIAMEIYQELLDTLSAALLSGDHARFLAHIVTPHRMVTDTKTIHVPDLDSARVHFDRLSQSLRAQGITQYIRIASSARFDGPDQIRGEHISHMLRGAVPAAPAFGCEMQLICRDGVWGVLMSRHKARYLSWPELLPQRPVGDPK